MHRFVCVLLPCESAYAERVCQCAARAPILLIRTFRRESPRFLSLITCPLVMGLATSAMQLHLHNKTSRTRSVTGTTQVTKNDSEFAVPVL
jgi:hypothetical protein